MEQNQQKLLRICSVYAEDSDDKKDLFQESVINIWQAMPSCEGKSSISTWMFRITFNVCLRLQSQGARKRGRFLKMDSIAIESVPGEDAGGEHHERLEKIDQLIDVMKNP